MSNIDSTISKRLIFAICLTAITLVAEVIGGAGRQRAGQLLAQLIKGEDGPVGIVAGSPVAHFRTGGGTRNQPAGTLGAVMK